MDDFYKKRFKKTLSFMDVMIRAVFAGTFVFTGVVLYFVWHFGWEGTLLSIIDRWFTIMVSELLIMGVIQIGKQAFSAFEKREVTKKEELQLQAEIDKKRIEEGVIDDY